VRARKRGETFVNELGGGFVASHDFCFDGARLCDGNDDYSNSIVVSRQWIRAD